MPKPRLAARWDAAVVAGQAAETQEGDRVVLLCVTCGHFVQVRQPTPLQRHNAKKRLLTHRSRTHVALVDPAPADPNPSVRNAIAAIREAMPGAMLTPSALHLRH